MTSSRHHTINYAEFPSRDLEACKAFFTAVFGWQFIDYGPDYAAFSCAEAGLDGGFFTSDKSAETARGSALIVLFSDDLEATLAAVIHAGGRVCRPIFSFPGGRRFHFTAPGGSELAVWSHSSE